MSAFGWSYPPGCSGPPEYPEDCAVCGVATLDNCVCPECPECGEFGNPDCYEKHGLVRSQRQIDMFRARQEADAKHAKDEAEWLARHFAEEQEYMSALEDHMRRDCE